MKKNKLILLFLFILKTNICISQIDSVDKINLYCYGCSLEKSEIELTNNEGDTIDIKYYKDDFAINIYSKQSMNTTASVAYYNFLKGGVNCINTNNISMYYSLDSTMVISNGESSVIYPTVYTSDNGIHKDVYNHMYQDCNLYLQFFYYDEDKKVKFYSTVILRFISNKD